MRWGVAALIEGKRFADQLRQVEIERAFELLAVPEHPHEAHGVLLERRRGLHGLC